MYPMLRGLLLIERKGLFPSRRQDLDDTHVSLLTGRTSIQRLSGKGLVTGFPVLELGIVFGWRGIKELATE